MPRQELSSGPGWASAATCSAYIWPRSWRKPETLTLPIRLGCAFAPKSDLGSHASDQSLKLAADRRATTSCLTKRSPPPVRPPTSSPPAQNCLWFHDQHRITSIAEPSTRGNPKVPSCLDMPRSARVARARRRAWPLSVSLQCRLQIHRRGLRRTAASQRQPYTPTALRPSQYRRHSRGGHRKCVDQRVYIRETRRVEKVRSHRMRCHIT
jgi:hypothetical protein